MREEVAAGIRIEVIPYELKFKRPAQTSRGVYHTHQIWYVVACSQSDPDRFGVGECAPLFDLSCDYHANYEQQLREVCAQVESTGKLNHAELKPYPSILFGLETAFRHYQQKSFKLWDNTFSQGQKGIPINGLIWMGDFGFMREQIEEKLKAGFRCVKLKIGAINFDEELLLLRHIRQQFSAEQMTLRVDANGAFKPEEAMEKLKHLAELELHSIEQPIRAGQWEAMAQLTRETPLPIALDEELIGIHDFEKKRRLLESIQPQYIILKPTLHGGISGSEEWIDLANSMGIDWWVTSALESNIGLNAIAQWCASLNNSLPQGLGTGALYINNVEMPLTIRKDCLWFEPSNHEYVSHIKKLLRQG